MQNKTKNKNKNKTKQNKKKKKKNHYGLGTQDFDPSNVHSRTLCISLLCKDHIGRIFYGLQKIIEKESSMVSKDHSEKSSMVHDRTYL